MSPSFGISIKIKILRKQNRSLQLLGFTFSKRWTSLQRWALVNFFLSLAVDIVHERVNSIKGQKSEETIKLRGIVLKICPGSSLCCTKSRWFNCFSSISIYIYFVSIGQGLDDEEVLDLVEIEVACRPPRTPCLCLYLVLSWLFWKCQAVDLTLHHHSKYIILM